MNIDQFLEGCFLGFSVGTTIGVSGILCLQNMMTGRLSLALVSVVAAACADMSCGLLALFGMQFIENFLAMYQKGLTVAAGVLLCFLGIKKLFEKVVFIADYPSSKGLLAGFSSIYFLGMIDPVSALDFIALSVGLALDFSTRYNTLQFILGIFIGSFSWWMSLFILISFLKKGIPVQFFEYIQYFVGAFIFGIGLWTLWSALI
jgi:arginine exporter protein ArgO